MSKGKQSTKTGLWLAIVVVLIVAIGGGYYFWNESNKSAKSTSEIQSSEPDKAPVAEVDAATEDALESPEEEMQRIREEMEAYELEKADLMQQRIELEVEMQEIEEQLDSSDGQVTE